MEGDAMNQIIEDAKAEVRRRWHRMTPFRLGLVIGEGERHVACPYISRRSKKLYAEGLAFSRAQAGKRGEA